MKKAEEYLEESKASLLKHMKGLYTADGEGNDFDKITKVIKQAQQDAIEETLGLALIKVKANIITKWEGVPGNEYPNDIVVIEKQSILSLKDELFKRLEND